MATVQPAAAPRASTLPPNRKPAENDDPLGLSEFDEELKRLSAANQELLAEFKQKVADPSDAAITEAATLPPAIAEEIEFLRLENTELRARIDQLEAMGGGKAEKLWQERQREYEMLLEEKSEVIRSLHQKIQEINESAIGGPAPAPSASMSGSRLGQAPGASSVRLGQAEEILRLKRELDEQRKQLEQDEDDMMAQMKQMEITMAKERAEMARQRQEVQRLQADLAHEIEQSGRAPELRERLNNLRRTQEVKPAAAAPPIPASKPKADQQKSSGFFRRLFG